ECLRDPWPSSALLRACGDGWSVSLPRCRVVVCPGVCWRQDGGRALLSVAHRRILGGHRGGNRPLHWRLAARPFAPNVISKRTRALPLAVVQEGGNNCERPGGGVGPSLLTSRLRPSTRRCNRARRTRGHRNRRRYSDPRGAPLFGGLAAQRRGCRCYWPPPSER